MNKHTACQNIINRRKARGSDSGSRNILKCKKTIYQVSNYRHVSCQLKGIFCNPLLIAVAKTQMSPNYYICTSHI